MTEDIDGGPAFPVPMIPCDRQGGFTDVRFTGMSLRAWLAGQALAGFDILGLNFGTIKTPEHPMPWVAEQCVAAADAVIAELGKEKGP